MDNSRTIPEVAADIVRQASTLLRTEANLARAEMSENLEALSGGVRMMIIGATLVMPGLVLLLGAGAAATVAAGVDAHWALAMFGGGALVIGILLTVIGRRRMKLSRLKPQKALDELNRDVALAKEQMGMRDEATRRAA
jgi:membrane protein implicated in regulation of membrane protease activity